MHWGAHVISFPEIIGHRGVRGQHVPENSIAAFREAINQGAGGIELDARICETGEIVVFHDKTLEVLTNGVGAVKQTDFKTLRGLKLLATEHGIPTLDEVLDALEPHLKKQPDFLVNVEIKGKDSPAGVVAILRRRLEGGRWQPHNLTVSHFHHERLALVKEQLPEIPLGLLFDTMGLAESKMFRFILPLLKKWGAVSANLPIECYGEGYMSIKLRNEGIIPVAWTSNEESLRKDRMARAVVEQGIRLITDYPGAMLKEIAAAKSTISAAS
jgi:glycerophosphoryl diester phosphodiesterase